MCALGGLKHREAGPFLRQLLAKRRPAQTASHEFFITATLQQVVTKPVLKIAVEDLRQTEPQFDNQIR
ncbi:hypothetical protein [Rhizobium sp. CG4]|uniref:hypothetical protein n=1 Tax=Rhizobium sp. CG4 TaxID=2726075 RepID=UPI00332FEF0D